jgi:hypothetical protein
MPIGMPVDTAALWYGPAAAAGGQAAAAAAGAPIRPVAAAAARDALTWPRAGCSVPTGVPPPFASRPLLGASTCREAVAMRGRRSVWACLMTDGPAW